MIEAATKEKQEKQQEEIKGQKETKDNCRRRVRATS